MIWDYLKMWKKEEVDRHLIVSVSKLHLKCRSVIWAKRVITANMALFVIEWIRSVCMGIDFLSKQKQSGCERLTIWDYVPYSIETNLFEH